MDSLFFIFAFIKFCKEYAPQITPITSGIIAALNPYVIYGNAGYTESLFLFLSCFAFVLLKRKKYLTHGLVGALLGITRIVGIFIAASYTISAFKDFINFPIKQKIVIALGGVMIGVGLLGFIIFLHYHSGDPIAFIHIQQAPGWGRSEIRNPFLNLTQNLAEFTNPPFRATISLVAIIFVIYLFCKKQYELAAFSALCTLIPLSTGLFSMPRFIWFQAPLLMVIAQLLNNKKVFYFVIYLLISLMVSNYNLWLNNSKYLL